MMIYYVAGGLVIFIFVLICVVGYLSMRNNIEIMIDRLFNGAHHLGEERCKKAFNSIKTNKREEIYSMAFNLGVTCDNVRKFEREMKA